MCLAIPMGSNGTNNESQLWRTIRSNPAYLLSLGVIVQLVMLFIFLLSIENEWISPASLIIKPEFIILYVLSYAIAGFLYFAFSMHFCPKKMQTGNIEYLYYGGLFYLGNYNLALFYLATFFSYALIISSAVFQLILMLFAFKPIWHAYFWSDKKNKSFAVILNSLFFLLLSAQLLILFLIMQ